MCSMMRDRNLSELPRVTAQQVGRCLVEIQFNKGSFSPAKKLYFVYEDLVKAAGTEKADELFKKAMLKKYVDNKFDFEFAIRSVGELTRQKNENWKVIDDLLDVLERIGVAKRNREGGVLLPSLKRTSKG